MISWLTLLAVALWYCFSIALSSYNKYMFGESHLENQVPDQNGTITVPPPQHSTSLPLLTTALHLLIQFLLSGGILLVLMNRPQTTGEQSWKPWRRNSRPQAGRYTNLDEPSVGGTQMPSHQDESSYLDLRAPQDTKSSRWTYPPIPNIRYYCTALIPCAIATAADIGLSNVSLRYITLTLYTMVKSTTPIFVLLAAFFLRLEPVRWQLVAVVVVMCSGVAVMVAGPSDEQTSVVRDHWFYLGFLLVFIASAMSGFRWGLTQLLLDKADASRNDHGHRSGLIDGEDIRMQAMDTVFELESIRTSGDTVRHFEEEAQSPKTRGRRSSVDRSRVLQGDLRSRSPSALGPTLQQGEETVQVETNTAESPKPSPDYPPHLYTMFLLSPIMSIMLFLASLVAEHPFTPLSEEQHPIPTILLLKMMAGGVLAFCMVNSELWLITLAGAVTMSVAGIAKELLTIGAAALIFGDRLTMFNGIGLMITLCAIVYYHFLKMRA